MKKTLHSSDSGSEIWDKPLMKPTISSKIKQKPLKLRPKSKSKSKSKTRSEEELLTKKMKQYEQQIKELRKQVKEDKNNELIGTLNKTKYYNLNISEEYEKLIRSYEETIQSMKQNELNLLEELQTQSNICKDALNKLYLFQKEFNEERERDRQYFEDREAELMKRLEQGQKLTQDVDIYQKLKELQQKEQVYLEEIEQLRNKLASRNSRVYKEEELRQKLVEMEMKMEKWDEGLDKIRQLEQENQRLLLKVNQYEKKISKKDERERVLKEEMKKQYQELQTEIRYWKQEMDKVILENNLVISRLNPVKKY